MFSFHSSVEWEKLDADGRKKLGIDFDDDGEFWLVAMNHTCMHLKKTKN